jgi:hypothetical protein
MQAPLKVTDSHAEHFVRNPVRLFSTDDVRVSACSSPLSIFYTNDDDGIHLGCGHCKWEANVGFEATTKTARLAQFAHDLGEEFHG